MSFKWIPPLLIFEVHFHTRFKDLFTLTNIGTYQIMIIAITGLKRSGKDALAHYIHIKYGYKHVKVASSLKEVVKTLFSFRDDEIEGELKDTIHPTWNVAPRKIMDFLGTRVFQHEIQDILPDVGRTFWIRDLLARERSTDIVISDLRFFHEQALIREQPSVLIRVTRENTSEDELDSEKESKLLDVDYTIKNDGNIKSLYTQCDLIMRKVITQS